MNNFESNRLSGWTISALFLFPVLHSAPVWPSDNDHPVASEVATATPIEASGLRVYRDPVSGRLGPIPAGIQPPGLSKTEKQGLNRSSRGLQARTLPNGAVAIDLQGRFRSMAVVTTETNGKPEVNCTFTPAEANAALYGTGDVKPIK